MQVQVSPIVYMPTCISQNDIRRDVRALLDIYCDKKAKWFLCAITCNSLGTKASSFLEHSAFAAAVTEWTWWRGNGWDSAFDTRNIGPGAVFSCDKLWQARCTYESATATSHLCRFSLPHLSDLDFDHRIGAMVRTWQPRHIWSFFFFLLFIWNIFHFQREKVISFDPFGSISGTPKADTHVACVVGLSRENHIQRSRFICFVIFFCFVKIAQMEKTLAKWKNQNRRNIEFFFYFRLFAHERSFLDWHLNFKIWDYLIVLPYCHTLQNSFTRCIKFYWRISCSWSVTRHHSARDEIICTYGRKVGGFQDAAKA